MKNSWLPVPKPGQFAVRIVTHNTDIISGYADGYKDMKPMVEEVLTKDSESTFKLAAASMLTLATFDSPAGNYVMDKIVKLNQDLDTNTLNIVEKYATQITNPVAKQNSLLMTAFLCGEDNLKAPLKEAKCLEPVVQGEMSILTHAQLDTPEFKRHLSVLLKPLGERIDVSQSTADIIFNLRVKHKKTSFFELQKLEDEIRYAQPQWYRTLYEMARPNGVVYPRLGFITIDDCLRPFYKTINYDNPKKLTLYPEVIVKLKILRGYVEKVVTKLDISRFQAMLGEKPPAHEYDSPEEGEAIAQNILRVTENLENILSDEEEDKTQPVQLKSVITNPKELKPSEKPGPKLRKRKPEPQLAEGLDYPGRKNQPRKAREQKQADYNNKPK